MTYVCTKSSIFSPYIRRYMNCMVILHVPLNFNLQGNYFKKWVYRHSEFDVKITQYMYIHV